MPCHDFGSVAALGVLRAVAVLIWVGVVLLVALTVGGAAAEELSVVADIDVELLVVAVLVFVEVAVAVTRSAVADHCIDVELFQPCAIAAAAGPDGLDTAPSRARCRRHMRFGDDCVAPIDGAVIEIEESPSACHPAPCIRSLYSCGSPLFAWSPAQDQKVSEASCRAPIDPRSPLDQEQPDTPAISHKPVPSRTCFC